MKKPTIEQKKNYLKQYRLMVNRVERLAKRAGYWREKASSLSPPDLTKMGIKASGKTDLGDYVSKFLDLAEDCAQKAMDAERKRVEIESAIESCLEPTHALLLELHYIDGLSFLETAKSMQYSLEWVYQAHRQALSDLEIPTNFSSYQDSGQEDTAK